jgi:uncharacterized protein YggE
MRKIALLISCCLLVFRTHAEPELKGSAAELTGFLAGMPKVVVITGESELKVPADHAIVALKVSNESKSLAEALRLNQESRNKLLNYLKKQGIPEERVQAAKFSSTPKFGWLSEKAKSYRVENFLKVTVHDDKEFQIVSGAVRNSST